jgi:CheY-like chemotaxis protein
MKKRQTNKPENRSKAEPSKAAKRAVTVLHVDDDPNDTTLFQVACAKAAVDFELQNIEDGHEVIEYLSGQGKYADRTRYKMPSLVLLDLKMPKTTGLEILKWIRSHSILKEDMRDAYAGGANSYLVKPPNFESLVHLVRGIGEQLPVVSLPQGSVSLSHI